jgi:hypothetical protein
MANVRPHCAATQVTAAAPGTELPIKLALQVAHIRTTLLISSSALWHVY